MRKALDFICTILFIHKPTKIKKMTLETSHEIGQEVTDPKTGKTGTITAAKVVFTIEVPAQTIPAETLTDVELDG